MHKETYQTATLFGNSYISHAVLQFGDYDASCELERANVLFALRELTGKWSGEIEYTPDLDRISPHTKRGDEASKQWATWDILHTGILPSEDHATELLEKWSAQQRKAPPSAIYFTHVHGAGLWVRDIEFDQHSIREAIETYPVLCDDTNTEVELIMRDHAWDTTVRPDLERQIVHLHRTSSGWHKRLCGRFVDHQNHVYCGSETALKEAFWYYLNQRGDQGHFENTCWTGFDIDNAAESVAQLIVEHTQPNGKLAIPKPN